MKRFCLAFLTVIFFAGTSCNQETEIRRKLNSKDVAEVMEGAREASDSGDKKYVPLLLHDLANPSAGTSLKYKGFTVYTEKMFALEQILHVKPPKPYGGILTLPDSLNIKFMDSVWRAKIKH